MKPAFYSMGCGDRFGLQGEAQLQAFIEAKANGINVIPVWNKSNREHLTVKTTPEDVRTEADAAVKALSWSDSYFVDADHINLSNVDGFIESSDFFTLDVAEDIGKAAPPEDIESFIDFVPSLNDTPEAQIRLIAEKYLGAVQEAGRIYRRIAENKSGTFHVEVSMDETDEPQTPTEMLFILAMIAQEQIPVDTIAPKFSGRFNKGVDYVGDVAQFEKEFEQDVEALRFAAEQFGLKQSLRLSVHSGSDKFAIYPGINRILKKHGAGLHVKTAGTTWLEEVIGLAEAGGSGLEVARKVYRQALDRYDELAAPYATVIDIDPSALPSADEVDTWDAQTFAATLRHVADNPNYNLHFRQLVHVGYKVAAEMGDAYADAILEHRDIVARHVKENLLERHLMPIFG